jgi:hypothetical protein
MSDINLSRFGIYKSVCTENYVHKYFIQSLIASGLFTDLEIDLMENMINAEKFPCMKIRDMCNIFEFNCDVRYRPRDSEKNLSTMFIKSKQQTNRTVKLLLTYGHYCINESIIINGKQESINSIIYKLQNELKLRVLTQYELTLAARTHYIETYEHLEYHNLCYRMFTIESSKDDKKFYDAALYPRLKSPDVSEDCIPEFISYLRVYEHIDPRNYKSLALI